MTVTCPICDSGELGATAIVPASATILDVIDDVELDFELDAYDPKAAEVSTVHCRGCGANFEATEFALAVAAKG